MLTSLLAESPCGKPAHDGPRISATSCFGLSSETLRRAEHGRPEECSRVTTKRCRPQGPRAFHNQAQSSACCHRRFAGTCM